MILGDQAGGGLVISLYAHLPEGARWVQRSTRARIDHVAPRSHCRPDGPSRLRGCEGAFGIVGCCSRASSHGRELEPGLYVDAGGGATVEPLSRPTCNGVATWSTFLPSSPTAVGGCSVEFREGNGAAAAEEEGGYIDVEHFQDSPTKVSCDLPTKNDINN